MTISRLDWEVLEDTIHEPDTAMSTIHKVERAKVAGGWLVRAYSATMSSVDSESPLKGDGHGVGVGVGLTFVPDPDHAWRA